MSHRGVSPWVLRLGLALLYQPRLGFSPLRDDNLVPIAYYFPLGPILSIYFNTPAKKASTCGPEETRHFKIIPLSSSCFFLEIRVRVWVTRATAGGLLWSC